MQKEKKYNGITKKKKKVIKQMKLIISTTNGYKPKIKGEKVMR